MTTRTHFDHELKNLEEHLLRMGGKVSEMLHLAVESLANQDQNVAQRIIDSDDIIDDFAEKLQEECIRLIALQQPLAKDLRIITTILETSNDLERVADHATNIAEITLRIGDEKLIKPLVDIPAMAVAVEEMIHSSLESFVNRDTELAKKTCLQDDLIDQQYEKLLVELTGFIRNNGDKKRVIQAINLLFVARYLERVGDHATNIGERVIYLVTGERERY